MSGRITFRRTLAFRNVIHRLKTIGLIDVLSYLSMCFYRFGPLVERASSSRTALWSTWRAWTRDNRVFSDMLGAPRICRLWGAVGRS